MTYTSRARGSQKYTSQDSARLIIGIAVIAVFLIIVVYANRTQKEPPRLDVDTFCRVDQSPVSQTIVLVDNTDPFSPSQVAEFTKHLTDIDDHLDTGARLTVASISGELPADIPFSRCSPEKAHIFGILESLRRLHESPRQISDQYKKAFDEPIEQLEKQMLLNRTMPESPIIGSIEDVINQIGPQWSDAHTRNIIIFSDFLENTKGFSQFRSGNGMSFDQARQTIPYIRDARLELRATNVIIYQLTGRPNSKHLQTKANERFWQDLVKSSGGHLTKWIRLPANQKP